MARAKAFYEAVFQCSPARWATRAESLPGMEMLAFPSSMEHYGAAGTLVRPVPPSEPSWCRMRLQSGGGPACKEQDGHRIALHDTEGNLIVCIRWRSQARIGPDTVVASIRAP